MNIQQRRPYHGEQVLEKAPEIAGCAPLPVKWTRRSIYRAIDSDPRRAAEWEAHAQSRALETEDAREGIAALLQRRHPVFKGR